MCLTGRIEGYPPWEIVICIDVIRLNSYYISTRTLWNGGFLTGVMITIQDKAAGGLLLGIFAVVGVLGILAAIAIPHIGLMTHHGRNNARMNEYFTIRIAVTEMLNDSTVGTLVPVGPTTDMSQVRTGDTEPLVLTDYLNKSKSNTAELGCSYTFATYGMVFQEIP
jgi:hypothetical protein